MMTETCRQNGMGSRFRRGFTLVELLVVIVIIAILAALLLPAIAAAKRFADRTKAGLEVRSLDTAWNKYYTEYRRWPDWTAFGFADDPEAVAVPIVGDVVKMLTADPADSSGQNPKKMRFIQFQKFDSAGDPVNPWKRTDEPPNGDPNDPVNGYYYLKVDANFDNSIAGTGDPAAPPENPMRRFTIVWTRDVQRDKIMGSWDE